MTMIISILGLDTISASIGIALGESRDEFVCKGYDPEPLKFRTLKPRQVFDSIHHDPASCVVDAQLVFLSLPSFDIEQSLLKLKDSIRPEAVIICLTPTKVAVSELVKRILGPSIQFTALHFIFPPETNMVLNDPGQFASASLFEKIPAAIATSGNTNNGLIDLVTGLCSRLGAVPYFCDMLEMDGLISTSALLPQLVSAAFVNATLNTPGRQELEKFAGREYAAITSEVSFNDNSNEISHDAILQKEHVVRGLDLMLTALEDLKSSIALEKGKHLQELLEDARSRHENWLNNRNTGGSGTESFTDQVLPEKGDFWRQQLGVFGRKPGRDIKRS